ncbi:MAG: hypothetical protein ACOWWO_14355 [Peptococcaceae bacterium]
MDENGLSPEEALEKARKEGFAPGEHKVFVLAGIIKYAELMMVGSNISLSILNELLFLHADKMENALSYAFERLGQDAKVLVLPYGMITIPIVVG